MLYVIFYIWTVSKQKTMPQKLLEIIKSTYYVYGWFIQIILFLNFYKIKFKNKLRFLFLSTTNVMHIYLSTMFSTTKSSTKSSTMFISLWNYASILTSKNDIIVSACPITFRLSAHPLIFSIFRFSLGKSSPDFTVFTSHWNNISGRF